MGCSSSKTLMHRNEDSCFLFRGLSMSCKCMSVILRFCRKKSFEKNVLCHLVTVLRLRYGVDMEGLDPKHLLPGIPQGYCIPDFITCAEEEYLQRQIYNAPAPKWTQLSHRRLQNWGGIPHPNGMIAEVIPQWLQTYFDKVGSLGIFKEKLPNHVLVNEYKAGEGIMPHLDGPLFYPTIATISLGSHTLLDFTPIKKDQEDSSQTAQKYFSVYVPARSLLVLQENLYHDFMHGIQERTEDMVTDEVINVTPELLGQTLTRQTRISLTIRHVPKTSKMKIKLGR